MKKIGFILFYICFIGMSAWAQNEEGEETEIGFQMKNLFTGGSISLAFYNNTFLVGASPVFGYNVAKWLDAGFVFNYNYTSYRDYYSFDDRLRQSVYGGGSFIKLFPVRFLFAQAQVEHNFLTQKYIPADNAPSVSETYESNSFLIGGGYTSNRYPGNGQPFFYLAILFDVADNIYSPYTDAYGRSIPIFRAGLQVPLFQGHNKDRY